jgi:hypothetical protein
MISHRADHIPLVPPGGIDQHERDMTATFSADVTLRAARESLAKIGQWLPIDGDPEGSLGSLVERDSTGPLRLGFGAWRDLLLGVQFTNGKQELITAGGRTMKNVAGYDLTKFMVGQFGIFGKVVSLTVRTYRRPAGALLEVHPVSDPLPMPADPPQWAMLSGDEILFGYLGDAAALSYYAKRSRRVSRSVDEDMADRSSRWRAGGEITFRASVPPTRVVEFINTAGIRGAAADLSFGIVIGPVSDRDRLLAAANAIGGTVRIHKNGKLVEASTNPQERKIIEQLKAAFDPDGLLSPLPWKHP